MVSLRIGWVTSTSESTTNNPLDSGNPYSNAMLGVFQSYTEATNPTKPAATAVNIDWFVQDSWKVTRRLTLELGLRVAYFTPWDQTDGQQSSFALERYNPAKTPVLYSPASRERLVSRSIPLPEKP